jgi:hypothetical protein
MAKKMHIAYKTTSGQLLINCKSARSEWRLNNFTTPQEFDKLSDQDQCQHCKVDLAKKRALVAKKKAAEVRSATAS